MFTKKKFIGFLFLFALFPLFSDYGNKYVTFIKIKSANNKIIFSKKDFSDDKVKFYIYELPQGIVRFFVLKSSDGIIRAAFDACNACYKAKKGFHQEGDLTICNNCGNKYPSIKINDVSGGCYSVPLKRTFDGDKVIIDVSDLNEGLTRKIHQYF